MYFQIMVVIFCTVWSFITIIMVPRISLSDGFKFKNFAHKLYSISDPITACLVVNLKS